MAGHVLGPWTLRVLPWVGLGLILDGLRDEHGASAPADYVGEVLLTAPIREAFFALVDEVGLVVCRNVGSDQSGYRDVRGRSSKGRLSQGEYYHHDGCSGPIKPRVVEIRCPVQEVERQIATAIAPFPEVLYAMLRELPVELRSEGELKSWHQALQLDGELASTQWERAQGAANRAIRKGLSAEGARTFFRAVDGAVRAYREPWQMGEGRFIANANPVRTMQHRRAYLEPHLGGRPNGMLVKRWPANPELEPHG
jgi:hypothetical protein